jgi:plastocyanin
MKLRLLAAGLVASLLLPAPAHARPTTPEHARSGAIVTVEHLMFMPATAKVALGDAVTWNFPEVTPHTTTSDQGFWDSGQKSGDASYVHTFTSAGTFAYHCSIHSTMHGKVRVGLRVDVPSEAKRVVRWSTTKATGSITFDVQMKLGSGPWTDLRTDTTKPKATIGPFGDAPVKIRARTTKGTQDSGWSKPVTLRFA